MSVQKVNSVNARTLVYSGESGVKRALKWNTSGSLGIVGFVRVTAKAKRSAAWGVVELNTEDLVVVWDDLAEEGRIAAASSNLAGATKGEGVDVAGGGESPSSMTGDVGVSSLEESLVAGLHLRDESRLLRVGARGSAELQNNE